MSSISAHIADHLGSSLQGDERETWNRLTLALERINASSPHAPDSWREMVERQPVKPFPVYHLAAIELLLDESSGPANILASGLFHLVLEGGGISWELPPHTLLELGALLSLPSNQAEDGFVELRSVEDIAHNLENLRQRGQQSARTRHALCAALNDLLIYRARISRPNSATLLPAFRSWLSGHGFGVQDEAEKLLESLHGLEQESNGPGDQALTERAIDEAEELVGTLRSLVGQAVDTSGRDPNQSSMSLGQFSRTRQLSPSALAVRPRPMRPPSRDVRAEDAWTRQPLPPLTSTSSALRARRLQPSLDPDPTKVWESRLPWMGFFVLTFFIAAGLFIALREGGTEEPTPLAKPAVGRNESSEVKHLESGPSAEETAHQFAYAETIEERLGLISDLRHADSLREHFATASEEGEVEYVQDLGQGKVGTSSFYAFRVRFQSDRNRLICLTENSRDGKLYVDWEAYVRWCSIPLEEFYRGEGTTAEVRVFVERGDYYNYHFGDDEEYQCYQLDSPDCEDLLYGYVERGSLRHRLMEHLIKPDGVQRLTLTLQRPTESSEASQFEIVQLVAGDWVKNPNEALEGSALARDMVSGESSVWLPSLRLTD